MQKIPRARLGVYFSVLLFSLGKYNSRGLQGRNKLYSKNLTLNKILEIEDCCVELQKRTAIYLQLYTQVNKIHVHHMYRFLQKSVRKKKLKSLTKLQLLFGS